MFKMELRGTAAELLKHVSSSYMASSLKLRLEHEIMAHNAADELTITARGDHWYGNPFDLADVEFDATVEPGSASNFMYIDSSHLKKLPPDNGEEQTAPATAKTPKTPKTPKTKKHSS